MVKEVINTIQHSMEEFVIDSSEGEDLTVICLTGAQAEIALTALEEKFERDNPQPLTAEQLAAFANKPCFIKAITPCCQSYWRIMPEYISKNPRPFGYGTNWLPYAFEPKEDKE